MLAEFAFAFASLAIEAVPRPALAIVIRSDMLPPERRGAIEEIERDLARRVSIEDLKIEPVPARLADRGEARNLDACSINDADRIVDIDALVIQNDNRGWNSQGGHYGELRLAIVDCVAQSVTKANDDTLGRRYENVDRLSAKQFAEAFKDLEKLVIANLRQR